MPKYLIERELPNAGKLSPAELKAVSQKSCTVLTDMGPRILWINSYVTDDKIYCIYIADSEDLIREHGRRGEFPVTKISVVREIIDPATAEKAPSGV